MSSRLSSDGPTNQSTAPTTRCQDASLQWLACNVRRIRVRVIVNGSSRIWNSGGTLRRFIRAEDLDRGQQDSSLSTCSVWLRVRGRSRWPNHFSEKSHQPHSEDAISFSNQQRSTRLVSGRERPHAR